MSRTTNHDKLIGTVNKSAFDGAPPETLLIVSNDSDVYRPHGWNMFWNLELQNWVRVYDVNGNQPYPVVQWPDTLRLRKIERHNDETILPVYTPVKFTPALAPNDLVALPCGVKSPPALAYVSSIAGGEVACIIDWRHGEPVPLIVSESYARKNFRVVRRLTKSS